MALGRPRAAGGRRGSEGTTSARIVVADNHGPYRKGLRIVLESSLESIEITEVDTFEALLRVLEQPGTMNLALVDLGMPGIKEINVVRDLRRSFESTRFIVTSASDSLNIVLDALASGLHGFISKTQTDEEIVSAVSDVLSGRIYVPPALVRPVAVPSSVAPGRTTGGIASRHDPIRLTPRQREVLTLIAVGMSNKEIARNLDIAEPTTKIHVTALMRVLGVRNRTEAAMFAKSCLGWPLEAFERKRSIGVIGRAADDGTEPPRSQQPEDES